jgi:hypothetical protein
VLGSIVALERLRDGLDRRLAASVAISREYLRITCPVKNRTDDAHADLAGDVGDDVLQLHIHLRQCPPHLLDMGGCVIEQTLALAQVGAQSGEVARRMKAPAQQA